MKKGAEYSRETKKEGIVTVLQKGEGDLPCSFCWKSEKAGGGGLPSNEDFINVNAGGGVRYGDCTVGSTVVKG